MRRLLSDRVERPPLAGRWLLPGALALAIAAPVAAQQPMQDAVPEDTVLFEEPTDSVIGAAVYVGDDDASLELELSNGRTVELRLRNGQVVADEDVLGAYDEGGSLDRSWRSLLDQAGMASTDELAALLRDWAPPATAGAVGRELDTRLEQALTGVGGRAATDRLVLTSAEDSIEELLERIEELEADRDHEYVDRGFDDELAHDFLEGIATFFATLVWIGVLFALGAGLLFFGQDRLQRVASTVREEPLRSGLIGLAGAFLAIPFYVLVTLALAISILGIPLILAWGPLFPMMVVLAAMAGWLAVAYNTGDALVSGKLQARPLFQEAGGFKRIVVGIAVLLSPFLLASLFQMTSVLEWVGHLLFVLGIVGNMLIAAVGFGAVLVRGRDALDRHRERRAAARRARLEQAQKNVVVPENTNV